MKVSHPNLILTISAGRMTLTRGETHEVIMRHSTSRYALALGLVLPLPLPPSPTSRPLTPKNSVAYSTVDHEHPTTFCYVALPRNSKISLCHVFSTKSAKMVRGEGASPNSGATTRHSHRRSPRPHL